MHREVTLRDAARVPLVDLSDVAIVLDVDGTLLDIAPKPDDVHVPEGLRETLALLLRRLDGALAILSGRPLADIDRIFAPMKLPAAGGHGSEIRLIPDGQVRRSPTSPLNQDIRDRICRIAALDPGILIEDKPYSVAVHYRLAPRRGEDVRKAVARIRDEIGANAVEILPGKSVIEIKPRGFDKGTALRALMSLPPFAGRRPVFIGDDKTDDAAFAVLAEFGGIGFSVGGAAPGAAFDFGGPADVRRWLERLAHDRGDNCG
jgi:trehalose 6-phosphate phosphatase